jgi:hypothetical protein
MSGLSVEAKRAFQKELAGYRTDPVGFCRRVLGFEPHVGQQRWLLHSDRDENVLVTGNRYGKSHVAAAKRIWKCIYRIGWDAKRTKEMTGRREAYQSINVAPTADQAQLVFYKALGMLNHPLVSWAVQDIKMTPFPCVTFGNGAVFQARSTAGDGRRLLGHVFDDANWDEAAYEPKFATILDNVLRMRLVDRSGKLDCTSTGNGRNAFGMYFLAGLEGKEPDRYCQTGSSRENPNIDQDRVDKAAARMPERMRAQNIEGAIVEGGGNFFATEDLTACEDSELNEHAMVHVDEEGEVRHLELRDEKTMKPWCEAFPSHRYLHGWDLADKQDWTVGWTLDLSTTPITVVEFERFQRQGWDYNYARIRARQAKYRTPKATKIDSTGLGDVVENDLRDLRVEGVSFGGAGKKDALLTNLQAAFSLREFRMPLIQVAHNEFAFYERDDKELVQDCVMALAVAAWFARQNKPQSWKVTLA